MRQMPSSSSYTGGERGLRKIMQSALRSIPSIMHFHQMQEVLTERCGAVRKKASLKYIGETVLLSSSLRRHSIIYKDQHPHTTLIGGYICHYYALHGLSLSLPMSYSSPHDGIILKSIEEYTYKPEEKK